MPPAPLAEFPLHGHMIVFRLSLGLTILACESRYGGGAEAGQWELTGELGGVGWDTGGHWGACGEPEEQQRAGVTGRREPRCGGQGVASGNGEVLF